MTKQYNLDELDKFDIFVKDAFIIEDINIHCNISFDSYNAMIAPIGFQHIQKINVPKVIYIKQGFNDLDIMKSISTSINTPILFNEPFILALKKIRNIFKQYF